MHSILDTTSTSTNFEALFEAALAKFTKCTGTDLRNHPIATLIDTCTSPDAILAIFQEQSLAFHEFKNGDPLLIGRLEPIVDALHAISTNAALRNGASFVRSRPLRGFVVITHVYLRHFRLQILFFMELASSSPCVSLSHFPVPTSP
jgi:hypothetical protein